MFNEIYKHFLTKKEIQEVLEDGVDAAGSHILDVASASGMVESFVHLDVKGEHVLKVDLGFAARGQVRRDILDESDEILVER